MVKAGRVFHQEMSMADQSSTIWSDLVQLIGSILIIVGALLPVINPPGDAPIFLKMTQKRPTG